MPSPRSVARIVVGLGIFVCLVIAFALRVGHRALHEGAMAITAALAALTLAVVYRYVER